MSVQPVHGNYHGYYTKRAQIQNNDPRLAHLPADFFQGKRVLDIGCNEGWITCEVAQSWGASSVVGVDIDDALISAAWKRRRNLWSLQRPESELGTSQDQEPAANYFPASCLHMHGPLPLPTRQTDADITRFPLNVVFRAQDWTGSASSEQYDVILALSVTKWIHLNRGDEGIRQFFAKVASSLSPGGHFLLEAQSWEGYAKAKRMSETLKANYKTLQLRPADFHDLLTGIGFERRMTFQGNHASTDGFQRQVDLYRKV